MKLNCINCGNKFKPEQQKVYSPGRGCGKSLTLLYLNVRHYCCCEDCAREKWKKLYDEAEKTMLGDTV